ncbi:MAG: hypothetical protein M3R38_16910 [Actinomycetota bacterium]|nr:hypothetical protein [Actinomycetota bacterium]
MSNRQLDDRGMEAFEEEVDRLAEERGISFAKALALKTGDKPPDTKKRTTDTKKRTAMAEADLEELREGMRELQERSLRTLEMACGQRFTRMVEDGEIEKYAKERGLLYQDAFADLQDEAYRPHTEAVQSRRKRATAPVVDDVALDRKVEARSRREGISYEAALDAVLEEM